MNANMHTANHREKQELESKLKRKINQKMSILSFIHTHINVSHNIKDHIYYFAPINIINILY